MTTLHTFDYRKIHCGTKVKLHNGDTAVIMGIAENPLMPDYKIIGLKQGKYGYQSPMTWFENGNSDCCEFDIVGIYSSEYQVDKEIKQCSPHQNNGWISVDERLPEERQTVLIAIKNGRDYAISMATYQKHYEKMKWIEPNYDYYGIEEVTLDFNQVEYWQPLPQPPETE